MFIRLVIFITIVNVVYSIDYCDLKCKRGGKTYNHTMCLHPGCPLENSCAKMKQVPLTAEEREFIVHTHNKYRSIVAQGSVKGQPKSSKMFELVWDEELAKGAQCWANACKFEHDHCRKLPDEEVGQNIGMVGSTKSLAAVSGKQPLGTVIKHWYDEVKLVKPAVIKSFVSNSKYGHYTQLVWGTTKRVGCGRVFGYKSKGKKRKFNRVYLYCNYAEAGNWKKEAVYAQGKPCSGCNCSKKYKGLCKQ